MLSSILGMENSQLLVLGLALLVALFTSVWALSLWLGKASIVDSVWGVGFAVLAAVYCAGTAAASDGSARVVFFSVLLWALRLSVYLTWRNWGQAEDARYAAMREYWGRSFPWVSLFTVFLFQALLAWVIGMPLYAVFTGVQSQWNMWDSFGLALFGIGLTFETVADWQLASFKRNASNAGKVLQTGLWRYSRHPNYFGEALLWWGIFFFAVSHGGWWTVFSPLLMTFLLLRVSGVPLLERTMRSRHAEYAKYAARTSAFFPWWPRNENS